MKTCLACGMPLLPGGVSPYCSAKCAGGRSKKPAGRPKGSVEVPKKLPDGVLSMWKIRVCLHCQKEFRTGWTDHKDIYNPYCSLACLAATREDVERDNIPYHEAADRRQEQKHRQPVAVATCPNCARRLQDGVCYRCRE